MQKIFMTMAVAIIGLTMSVSSAVASPAADALGTCLADNMTGKDRKDMARWIFIAMSAHPEINSLSRVSKKDRDEINAEMGAMVTKLLTESCPVQAKRAMDEGTEAFRIAFGVVGQLAMQELMNNPEVRSSITGFAAYMDKEKVNSVFSKNSESHLH